MYNNKEFTRPPRRRVGALALIHEGERVLMVEKAYRSGPQRWGLPGGCVNPDEHVDAACAREVAEELGLRITPGRVLLLHHMPATDAEDGAAEGLNLVFRCGPLPDDTPIQLGPELHSYRWMTPADVRNEAAPYTAWRVEAALHQLREPWASPGIPYLHGHGHGQAPA